MGDPQIDWISVAIMGCIVAGCVFLLVYVAWLS